MTTQREQFEAWYDNGEPDSLPKDYKILGKNYLWMGWQAALSQPNEPVAWILKTGHGTKLELTKPECEVDYWKPLYTLPKE